MRVIATLMLMLVATVCWSANNDSSRNEIYRWVDDNGVVHFSDREPRAGSAERVSVHPELGTTRRLPDEPAKAATADDGQPATPAATDNQQPAASLADEKRAKWAKQRKDAARKKSETAAACDNARQRVARLEPSPRVMVTQEDGTVVRLDDDKRLELLQDARDYISRNCD